MKISYKAFANALKNIGITTQYKKRYNKIFRIDISETSISFTFFCNYKRGAEIHEVEYHPQTSISFSIPIEDKETDKFIGTFECDNLNGFIGGFNEKLEYLENLVLQYDTEKKYIKFIDDRNICSTLAHIVGSGFDASQFNFTKEVPNDVFSWSTPLVSYHSINIYYKFLKQFKKTSWNVMKESEYSFFDGNYRYSFIFEGSTCHVITTNSFTLNHIKYDISNVEIPFVGFSLKYHLFDIIAKANKYSVNIRFYNERVVELNFDIDDIKYQIRTYCDEGDLFVKNDDKWQSVYEIKENYERSFIKKVDMNLINRLVDLEDLHTLNISVDVLKKIVSDIKDLYTKEQLKYRNRYDGHSDIPKIEMTEDKDGLNICYQIAKVSNTLSGYIENETLKTVKYDIPNVKIPGCIKLNINYIFKIFEYLASYNKDITFTYSLNEKYYWKEERNQYSKPILIKTIDDKNEFVIAPSIKTKKTD